MRVNFNQLHGHLKRDLAPTYLVCGEEPLLVDEGCALIREVAQERGFNERSVMTVEPGFDWASLFSLTCSPSLFSPRRLIELRIANIKQSEAGADILVQIAEQPPRDVLLLVRAGKLDKRTMASRWVKALERAGVLVVVYALAQNEFPGWLNHRMRAKGLTPEPGVCDLLAYHFEGNLLAAAQEIDKFAMLHGSGSIGPEDIRDNLSDNARFNVFSLVDTCLRGELTSVVRILTRLRSEGIEPILILRVLTREVRTLSQVALRLEQGEREASVFQAYNIWSRRQPLIRKAIKRCGSNGWLDVLRQAARSDKVLKGHHAGNIWQELQHMAIAVCGKPKGVCE